MPEQTVGSVHFARPLENLSFNWYPKSLVGESMFNIVPVVHESDKYVFWNRDDIFRLPKSDIRQDGVRAQQVDDGYTYQGYFAEEHALETKLTDRERRNQDNQLALELTKVRNTQAKILLLEEIRIANLMANTANYAASNQVTLSGTNQWNNASFTGSIEQVMDGATEAVRIQTGGTEPNMLCIPKAVTKVVKRDARVRDLIKYTHSDLLVDGELPPMLWGLQVVIPAASYNNAIEGAAGTMTDVWGKNVFAFYKGDTAGLNVLGFGYIFRVGGLQVKTWRDEAIDTTYYRPAYIQVENIVSPFTGYLIQNCIA